MILAPILWIVASLVQWQSIADAGIIGPTYVLIILVLVLIGADAWLIGPHFVRYGFTPFDEAMVEDEKYVRDIEGGIDDQQQPPQ